jgi:hypothetical protein
MIAGFSRVVERMNKFDTISEAQGVKIALRRPLPDTTCISVSVAPAVHAGGLRTHPSWVSKLLSVEVLKVHAKLCSRRCFLNELRICPSHTQF